jgi:predicted ATPase/class 3 adenylate cyclase
MNLSPRRMMTPVRPDLPTGTVTFLFTDVEGSTMLLHELGADGYAEALSEHRRVLREAFSANGGVEVDTQGDAFFVAFSTAPGALAAAAEAQEGLAPGPIRLRMGIHTGTPHVGKEGYVGVDVHRAARIAACGHGGQVLVSASTASLLGTDQLRDLGEHRLKDLSAPERIYQLGDDDFPLLESLHQTNLPIPSTPFLGRERELGEVLGLLTRADVRLLTLTGPGGTGKTRLAGQAAGLSSGRYPQGVWWVPLAPLRDPELVLTTAGQTLGSKNGLAEHIADKRLLLLFDNFEHLVDAASDLAALLTSCPHLELLVTSREPLHLTGEHEFPVPSFVHEEGVGFFLARARAVKPDFQADEAVPEICRRLDDLPLALELAAARVKALSSAHILERLDQRLPLLTGGARDAPERQRTLRATIAWSHELLSEEERRLFARLSVFAGGCTLEAAEEVADADLDTLQSLLDKSLLRTSEDRYWMLETIREYAGERLEADGEAEELRLRHANWHLALAEEIASAEAVEGNYDRLEQEHDNLRAALAAFRGASNSAPELRLVVHLARFWYGAGHLREGLMRLDDVLGRADTLPGHDKLLAHYYAAAIALGRGDLERAEQHARAELEMSRALGEHDIGVWALVSLGHVERSRGRLDGARVSYEEALALARGVGDNSDVAAATGALGELAFLERDFARAADLAQQGIELATSSHWDSGVASGLIELAQARLAQERHTEASAALHGAVAVLEKVPFPESAAALLEVACRIPSAGRRALQAARLLGAAASIREEIGKELEPFQRELHDEVLVRLQEELGDAFEAARLEGASMTRSEAMAVVVEFLE